jgi:hypothetical protein
VASNPGRIPAGGKDIISVEVNTKNRGGKSLSKSFKVFTNDPAKSQVILKVTGKVKGYMTIAPAYVRLNGPVGRPISRTVRIIPMEGHPFAIKEVKAREDRFLRYEVKPLKKSSGENGYLLLVENTKKDAGNYRDTITIETDSEHKPFLRIPVYGRILDPSTQSGRDRK